MKIPSGKAGDLRPVLEHIQEMGQKKLDKASGKLNTQPKQGIMDKIKQSFRKEEKEIKLKLKIPDQELIIEKDNIKKFMNLVLDTDLEIEKTEIIIKTKQKEEELDIAPDIGIPINTPGGTLEILKREALEKEIG